MPAHNDEFPWMSYYGNYNFFEDIIRNHSRVSVIRKIDDGFYDIELYDGRILKVFICECYSYDIAEYYETIENLGKVDVVVINSLWCSYTLELKRHCVDHDIGLFDIKGFMSALNRERYWEFLTDSEKKSFAKKGWRL